jgi:type IV secretion system protein VirD4
VIGRLIARGLDDELRGTAFAVVDLLSICRAKEAQRVTTFGSARWAEAREVRRAGLLGLDGAVARPFGGRYLRHNGPVSATAA